MGYGPHSFSPLMGTLDLLFPFVGPLLCFILIAVCTVINVMLIPLQYSIGIPFAFWSQVSCHADGLASATQLRIGAATLRPACARRPPAAAGAPSERIH